MMDLAEKKGVFVDAAKLSERLGVTVIPTIASHGRGVKELMDGAVACVGRPCHGPRPPWSSDVEREVDAFARGLPQGFACVADARFTAVQMIESGQSFCDAFLGEIDPGLKRSLEETRARLSALRGRPAYEVIAAERHHLAQKIFEECAQVRRRPHRSWNERLDDVLMHPVIGYFVLSAVLLGFFFAVFKIGAPLESVLVKPLAAARDILVSRFGSGLLFHVTDGVLQGIGGGVAIVLPYFLPLLFLMALLEDAGYLARAGFLLDAFMHRIGLHGKSVAPFILGFGCNVPAISATRILESRRDRILTSLLIPFIPCSARTTVILALIAFFLGPWWALGFYVSNILLVALLSKVLSLFLEDDSPGLILEIPSLKVPRVKSILQKIWFQLRAFLRFAWPLLIAGSVLLGVLQALHGDSVINAVLAPLVAGLLGLPRALGVTLVFGFLRKELSLLMMLQALGTDYQNLPAVISRDQIVVFTVFVSLFIPCLSTFAVLWKESGRKVALLSAGLSVSVALLAGVVVRLLL
jgi:ferrous iron transport protein B